MRKCQAHTPLSPDTTAADRQGVKSRRGDIRKTRFSVDEVVEVLGEIVPEDDELNKRGDVFVVAHVQLAAGHSAWFYQNMDRGLQPWDGDLPGLQPAEELDALGRRIGSRSTKAACSTSMPQFYRVPRASRSTFLFTSDGHLLSSV